VDGTFAASELSLLIPVATAIQCFVQGDWMLSFASIVVLSLASSSIFWSVHTMLKCLVGKWRAPGGIKEAAVIRVLILFGSSSLLAAIAWIAIGIFLPQYNHSFLEGMPLLFLTSILFVYVLALSLVASMPRESSFMNQGRFDSGICAWKDRQLKFVAWLLPTLTILIASEFESFVAMGKGSGAMVVALVWFISIRLIVAHWPHRILYIFVPVRALTIGAWSTRLFKKGEGYHVGDLLVIMTAVDLVETASQKIWTFSNENTNWKRSFMPSSRHV